MNRVRLPGPKVPTPIQLPHILTIIDPGDGLDPEWTVDHHEECPRACFWWPEMARIALIDSPIPVDHEHHLCYVEYELDNIGLDGLDATGCGAVALRPPESSFEPEWKRMPPGRYKIEGWYQSGGSMPWGVDDPDGGLIVTEVLTPSIKE